MEPGGPNINLGLASNTPVNDLQATCTHMGLKSSTQGEDSKGLYTKYHQNLVENGSAWKVYVRGKGCRKKKAQNQSLDSPHAETRITAEVRMEEPFELQTIKQSIAGQKILMDPGPRELELHPATRTKDPSTQYNTTI